MVVSVILLANQTSVFTLMQSGTPWICAQGNMKRNFTLDGIFCGKCHRGIENFTMFDVGGGEQWWVQDFPGGANPKGGLHLLFDQFSQKLYENEILAYASLVPPPRSANGE